MNTVTVNEYLNTFKEVIEEFKNQQLEAFASPDVVRGATEFILRGANPPPAASGSVKTVTGTLQEFTKVKKGEFTRYAIKINGKLYSTCDGKAFGGKTFREGDTVIAQVTQSQKNPQYWDLVSLKHGEQPCPF